MNRPRLWLARLLVLLVTTIAALKISDVAVGWFKNTRARHLLRLPVNASFQHRSTEYDYTFTANAFGLRGPQRPWTKPQGTRRIVVLGDSFVAGFGVAENEVITAKLETIVNADSQPTVEVINAGRIGSSTIRELDMYTHIGRHLAPDVVVLAYFLGNDLVEVTEEHDQAELRRWHPPGAIRRAAYALCPNLYLELALLKLSAQSQASWQPRTEEELLSHLRKECDLRGAGFAEAAAAYQQLPAEVRRDLAAGLLHDHRILPACFASSRFQRALNPDDAYFERAWPRTEQHLELLCEAVADDGARLIVLLIPDATQVDPAAHQFAAEIGYRVNLDWLTGSCRTSDAIADWCRRAKTPCLDLTADLRQSPEPVYYRQDGHWNPAGHDLAAKKLAEFLPRIEDR